MAAIFGSAPFCFKTILGAFQIGSMMELVINVQLYALKISQGTAEKRLW